MPIVDPKLAAGEEIVAKIYDPMYDVDGRAWPGGARRSMACSKENETRAYNRLIELQGSIIPKFFGESVCYLPMDGGSETRSVFVLLFELERSLTLSDYFVNNYSIQKSLSTEKQKATTTT